MHYFNVLVYYQRTGNLDELSGRTIKPTNQQSSKRAFPIKTSSKIVILKLFSRIK